MDFAIPSIGGRVFPLAQGTINSVFQDVHSGTFGMSSGLKSDKWVYFPLPNDGPARKSWRALSSGVGHLMQGF